MKFGLRRFRLDMRTLSQDIRCALRQLPQVAEKIIAACHSFMLLLATEGPRKTQALN